MYWIIIFKLNNVILQHGIEILYFIAIIYRLAFENAFSMGIYNFV